MRPLDRCLDCDQPRDGHRLRCKPHDNLFFERLAVRNILARKRRKTKKHAA